MAKLAKSHWPGFVLLSLFALYSIAWFVMAGKVEGGIERWVDRQAKHGTEVSYDRVKISGYPFRLQASFDNPQIIAREHDSGFSWTGERMRLVTQVFNINHVIIDLFGQQSLSWLDAPADGSRSPSTISTDFTGEQLRGSLLLKSGQVQNIDTDFRKVIADVYTDGAITLFADGSDHLEMELIEYHSRQVKTSSKDTNGFRRDVMMKIIGLTTEEKPSTDLAPEIEELVVAFSEEIADASAIHSGDIGANLPPTLAQKVYIHDAHIKWAPLSARLDGTLRRKSESARFDGDINLYLKGHEDLVRQAAEAGETDPTIALVAGALFGVLDMVTKETDEGETIIPLDVKDGEVYFGFLPLFQAK